MHLSPASAESDCPLTTPSPVELWYSAHDTWVKKCDQESLQHMQLAWTHTVGTRKDGSRVPPQTSLYSWWLTYRGSPASGARLSVVLSVGGSVGWHFLLLQVLLPADPVLHPPPQFLCQWWPDKGVNKHWLGHSCNELKHCRDPHDLSGKTHWYHQKTQAVESRR